MKDSALPLQVKLLGGAVTEREDLLPFKEHRLYTRS